MKIVTTCCKAEPIKVKKDDTIFTCKKCGKFSALTRIEDNDEAETP